MPGSGNGSGNGDGPFDAAAARTASVWPGPRPPTLADVVDLRLQGDGRSVLEHALRLTGGSLTDEERRSPYEPEPVGQMTVAHLPSAKRYVLQFPRWALSDPSYWKIVKPLQDYFPQHASAVLLCEHLQSLLRPYERLFFKDGWPPRVETKWMTWLRIEELQAGPDEERIGIVKDYFGEESFQRPIPKIEDLSQEDRVRIVEALAARAEGRPTYYVDLVRRLALPEQWVHAMPELQGSVADKAYTLLHWAFAQEWFPDDADRRNYTVAGALLEQLAQEMGAEGAKQTALVIVRHRLVIDAATIENLCSQYGLRDFNE